MIANQSDRSLSSNSFQHVLLAGLLMLASVGCAGGSGAGTASGTSTSTSSGTTQPSQPAPPVPAGWVNVDRPHFSYSYPTSWKLLEIASATQPSVDASDPTRPLQGQVLVQFLPGYPNNQNNGDQCADADQYLWDFYNANFLPLTKDPHNSVTWQYLPSGGGRLGGAAGTVSISSPANSGNSGNYLVDLEAVPRADGLYLIAIWSPDYLSTPSLSRTFLSTLDMKSGPLPKGSNCSSLN